MSLRYALGRLPRPFHISRVCRGIRQMPPRPSVAECEIEENFLRGSGPGGQKINKTSSAVQLKHLPTGTVVKSQATRSRSQNRKKARELLAEKLEFLEKGDQSRKAVLQTVASKRKASASKKKRRKYRKLEEEKSLGPNSANSDEEAATVDPSRLSQDVRSSTEPSSGS